MSRLAAPFRIASAALLGLALAHAAAAAEKAWPINDHLARFSAAADSAWNVSAARGAAFADSLIALGRERRSRSLVAAAYAWRGRKLANWYRLPEAAADLDSAWTIATATRDTSGYIRVLAARAHGSQVRGEHEGARRWYAELLRMTRRAGFTGMEGFAHRGLGYEAKEAGRYPDAERELKAAIRMIPADRFENRHSRFLLGEVYNRTGRHDEARSAFLELLDQARAKNDHWLQAATLNDLGILEYEEGDNSRASQYWAFAQAVFDSMSNPASAVAAGINRSHALVHLGRTDEARALVLQLLDYARTIPDPMTRISLRGELGHVERAAGRTHEAEALFRSVRAAAVDDAAEWFATSQELAALLRDSGRLDESEALLDSVLTPEVRIRMQVDDLGLAYKERAQTRLERGRPAEALADAREGERITRTGRQQGSIYWLDSAVQLGRCQREAGFPDSAVAVLGGALRAWERWRAEISDLAWRERSGSGLVDLFTELGLALLDPRRGGPPARRTREAFDALQTFQARTLEERMHGVGLAGRGMRARVSADSLRRGVLGEGELLVDVLSGPDTSFAFLVSRRGIECRLLPGSKALTRLYTAWQEATVSGADAAIATRGLERLSAVLLAPIAEPVRAGRRLVLTGGGPLALWPVGALTLPGEKQPLCATREISTAPSATLLAALRAGAPAGPRATGGLLAIGRTTDASGRALPGAQRELGELLDRFGAEVRVNRGDRTLAEITRDLPRWDVLHFAAHAEAETGSPWRSGFLLGRGAGDDAYLRAGHVAKMKLAARLAVLSGCQSAGATTLAGEGALGLASAFLCSGTTSVVATLWPVEDRAAEQFMSEFYAALARGRSVAAAVCETQRALRQRPETANPRDWAAFVAAGEGGTHVRLESRLTTPAAGRPMR